MSFARVDRSRRHRLGVLWLVVVSFMAGSATTGGAVAAGLIRSADIADGQVKRADIADNAVNSAKVKDASIQTKDLASPKWTYVAPAHQVDACATKVATFCGSTELGTDWRNYGAEWQTARFRRDVTGEVELEGTIDPTSYTYPIFVLPKAYRPKKGHIFAVSCYDPNQFDYVASRVSVRPEGAVVWEGPTQQCGGSTYLSFDGIRFSLD